MKVLSNILGVNKKININSIAIKDENKFLGLDDFLKRLISFSKSPLKFGKWLDVDGRDIYRKVYDCGYLGVANDAKFFPIEIEEFEIVNLYGVARNTSTNTTYPLPYSNGTDFIELAYVGGSTKSIRIKPSTDRVSFYCYVIVEYIRK